MTDELRFERVRRADDNTKIDPVDLLETIVDDIRKGEIKCDGLAIITIHRPEEGPWIIDRYRCGLKRLEEIAVYGVGQDQAISSFKG